MLETVDVTDKFKALIIEFLMDYHQDGASIKENLLSVSLCKEKQDLGNAELIFLFRAVDLDEATLIADEIGLCRVMFFGHTKNNTSLVEMSGFLSQERLDELLTQNS